MWSSENFKGAIETLLSRVEDKLKLSVDSAESRLERAAHTIQNDMEMLLMGMKGRALISKYEYEVLKPLFKLRTTLMSFKSDRVPDFVSKDELGRILVGSNNLGSVEPKEGDRSEVEAIARTFNANPFIQQAIDDGVVDSAIAGRMALAKLYPSFMPRWNCRYRFASDDALAHSKRHYKILNHETVSEIFGILKSGIESEEMSNLYQAFPREVQREVDRVTQAHNTAFMNALKDFIDSYHVVARGLHQFDFITLSEDLQKVVSLLDSDMFTTADEATTTGWLSTDLEESSSPKFSAFLIMDSYHNDLAAISGRVQMRRDHDLALQTRLSDLRAWIETLPAATVTVQTSDASGVRSIQLSQLKTSAHSEIDRIENLLTNPFITRSYDEELPFVPESIADFTGPLAVILGNASYTGPDVRTLRQKDENDDEDTAKNCLFCLENKGTLLGKHAVACSSAAQSTDASACQPLACSECIQRAREVRGSNLNKCPKCRGDIADWETQGSE